MRGARLLTATAAVVVVGAILPSAPAVAQAAAPADPVVGLVVTREPGTSARRAESLVADEVGPVEGRTPIAPGVTAVAVPGLDPSRALQVAADLEEVDGVARVDLDTRVLPDAIPDDPRFGEQWGLTDPVSGVSAPAAWDLTTGSGQVIAVIDTGITAHEDLTANVLPGYDMIDDAVVAHDGDGRDSDASDEGDWLTNSEIATDPDTFAGCAPQATSSWHGTHVAGIAAATGFNGKGIVGMAPGAAVQPVRALGKCGGSMSDIAAAITWASGGEVPGLPLNPTPADVITLSLSSAVTCQPFVQAAIDDALARGASIVASAGNTGQPFTQVSPAGCYDVIAVGAVTRTGNRAPYSNYGVPGRDLPLFAPGGTTNTSSTGILSTVDLGATTPTSAGYTAYYGTSMAAPFVAGAAAMLRARTGMEPAAVAEHLRDTARPFPAGSTCTGTCGAGILDVDAALRTTPRLSVAPGGVTVSAADSSVAVSWTAPTDPGSAPVTGYDAEYRASGGNWTAVDNPWPSTLREKIIYGLTNGVTYQVRVAARTVFGRGAWAESNPVTPRALPGATQIRRVRYPTKTSVRLGLRLPADHFVGMQYRLTETATTGQQWVDVPVAETLRLSGLARGVRHTVEVRVVNEMGAGPAAVREVATPVKPGKVRALVVKRRGTRADLTWSPPRRTGMQIRYRVRTGRTGAWQATKRTSMVLRKVPAGPLLVQVQALNEAGRSATVSMLKRK